MAEENIKIEKTLYSRSEAIDFLDLSFNELANTNNKSTDTKIKNLFQDYNKLFYDISKEGELSHSTLFIQSRDYVNDFYDPKDDQIEALLDRIETLEDELLEVTSNANLEHPIYNDGSFIQVNGNSTIYFMYRGRACAVSDNVYDLLAKKYNPYVFGVDYNGSKFDPVDKIANYSGLPRRGPTLNNSTDVNNIDDKIKQYLDQ